MTTQDAWMPFYVIDYLKDTSRLTTTEHGAYLLLIMEYWRNGPLPNDDKKLSEIAMVSKFMWKKFRKNLINFFQVDEKFLHHKRIDKELNKLSQVVEKYDENLVLQGESFIEEKNSYNGLKSKATTKTLRTTTTTKANSKPTTKAKENIKEKSGEKEEKFLPDWLKKETWELWIEHRKEIKKPLTKSSEKFCIARLKKLSDMGFSPESVVEQSIIGRYVGLFPTKPDTRADTITETRTYQKSFADQSREFADRLTGRKGDSNDIIDIN